MQHGYGICQQNGVGVNLVSNFISVYVHNMKKTVNGNIILPTGQWTYTGWVRKDAPLKNFYNSKTIWDRT